MGEGKPKEITFKNTPPLTFKKIIFKNKIEMKMQPPSFESP